MQSFQNKDNYFFQDIDLPNVIPLFTIRKQNSIYDNVDIEKYQRQNKRQNSGFTSSNSYNNFGTFNFYDHTPYELISNSVYEEVAYQKQTEYSFSYIGLQNTQSYLGDLDYMNNNSYYNNILSTIKEPTEKQEEVKALNESQSSTNKRQHRQSKKTTIVKQNKRSKKCQEKTKKKPSKADRFNHKLGQHEVSTKTSRQKIKLDQGYKPFIRGIRHTLKRIFEDSGLAIGFYHWNDSRLFKKVKYFLQNIINYKYPSNYDVWATVLLIYRTKGIKGKECEELVDELEQEGIKIFREIFVNNNKYLIQMFFNHSLIQKLWPFIIKNCVKADFFKGEPSEKVVETYRKITSMFQEKFGLGLPKFWKQMFSSRN